MLEDTDKESKFKLSSKEGSWTIGRTFKIVSEYDQEIPQSQTADNPMAPLGK